jgi:DNA mismatch endonuclease (patch repair protein)
MDPLSPQQRSERMSRVRHKDTEPELVVRRLVHGLGYRYRLHAARLPGKPDLVFAARQRVIFVHGCFWHQHRPCRIYRMPRTKLDFWLPKLEANKKRYARNRRQLRALGWKSLVVWECELRLRGRDRIKRRIQAFLGAQT